MLDFSRQAGACFKDPFSSTSEAQKHLKISVSLDQIKANPDQAVLYMDPHGPLDGPTQTHTWTHRDLQHSHSPDPAQPRSGLCTAFGLEHA